MNVSFTIVTVVFNGEDTIKKTIDSVINQEYLPFEYLIIDGKSNDMTLQIIDSYKEIARKKGINLSVTNEKDTGIYNAMNKGIITAKGDFISFLNAGDWYELDALKNVNDLYNKNEFELTYGGLHYITPNGSIINKMSKIDKFLVSSRNWNHPSMFLKREIYQNYGFNEDFKVYSDFDLYVKLRKTDIKIIIIDKVVTNFVADGVSTNANLKNALERAKEKYTAYRDNGYSAFYWIEAYGWEMFKLVYLKIRG